ncbi:MAG: alpha/beta hydrolase [Phormidesmis sp.]
MNHSPLFIKKIPSRKLSIDAVSNIPSYFVASTAPINIDTNETLYDASESDMKEGVRAIARDLYRASSDPIGGGSPQLIVAVHGYNTLSNDVESWYESIGTFTSTYAESLQSSVFIGYRWPSETIGSEGFWVSFTSLPFLPRLLSGISLFLIFFGCVIHLRGLGSGFANLILFLAIVLAALLGSLILFLLTLRSVAYFRDYYRATEFGVTDLANLLTLVDSALTELPREELEQKSPIGLSFIAHSMGSLVVTKTITRIVDIFDRRSIAGFPTSEVANSFTLRRLVLASPDLPSQVIASTRNNDIQTCLRRFSEVYVFTSEGDIALRLASTAANYFFFPVKKRISGYRLGNISVRFDHQYGICNLVDLRQHYPLHKPTSEALISSVGRALDSVEITFIDGFSPTTRTLKDIFGVREDVNTCNLITFIDCTNYRDVKVSQKQDEKLKYSSGLLTRARGKRALNLLDYLLLTLDYATHTRDVHGGYFKGEFSQYLLYNFLFLGFEGTLSDQIKSDVSKCPESALDKMDKEFRRTGIKVLLSPIRYRVDVQGASVDMTLRELLSIRVRDN